MSPPSRSTTRSPLGRAALALCAAASVGLAVPRARAAPATPTSPASTRAPGEPAVARLRVGKVDLAWLRRALPDLPRAEAAARRALAEAQARVDARRRAASERAAWLEANRARLAPAARAEAEGELARLRAAALETFREEQRAMGDREEALFRPLHLTIHPLLAYAAERTSVEAIVDSDGGLLWPIPPAARSSSVLHTTDEREADGDGLRLLLGRSAPERLAGARDVTAALRAALEEAPGRRERAARSGLRLGVVDVWRAMRECSLGREVRPRLAELHGSAQREIDAARGALAERRARLERERPRLALDDPRRRALEEEQAALARRFAARQRELLAEEARLYGPALASVKRAVERVVARAGLSAVVDPETGATLYATALARVQALGAGERLLLAAPLDVTDEVILAAADRVERRQSATPSDAAPSRPPSPAAPSGGGRQVPMR